MKEWYLLYKKYMYWPEIKPDEMPFCNGYLLALTISLINPFEK